MDDNLAQPELLYVTDLEASGDQFSIYDNGSLLGGTSAAVKGDYRGHCISCVWADANFSRGVFLLPAGVNVISGIYNGGVGAGDFAFGVAVPVPEPAAWALMLCGIAGLGLALRSRRRPAIA